MANKLPVLLQQTDLRNVTTYRFGVSSDFPHSEWVPTLVDIQAAETFGQQREALGKAILCVAASHKGLKQISGGRIRPMIRDVEARFRIGAGEPKLTYMTAGWLAIGYQTPDEVCPHPAFAVLDTAMDNRREVHEVIRDPSEPLTHSATQLGINTVYALANVLDARYPDFELKPKLHDALEALSELP